MNDTAIITKLGHQLKVTTQDGKLLGFLTYKLDGSSAVSALRVEAGTLKFFGDFDSPAEAASHLIMMERPPLRVTQGGKS